MAFSKKILIYRNEGGTKNRFYRFLPLALYLASMQDGNQS
jgi:hypothetical protein